MNLINNTQTMSSREIPEFLIKLSEQMNRDPNRATAHPFWQVRTKEYLVTEQGYNEHHWEIIDSKLGSVYRSDTQELSDLAEFLKENHTDWFLYWASCHDGDQYSDLIEVFESNWDEAFDTDSLPNDVYLIHVQEVERVLSTHLTQSDAEWFINRCSHHYSTKLYTYVESAYWAPELRELQDWIKSLTAEKPLETKE